MSSLQEVYQTLLNNYGSQGWWPIVDLKTGKSIYKTKLNGRTQSELSAPKKLIPSGKKNNEEILEIALGAILTQNVSFKNVEKAILNLKKTKNLTYNKLLKIKIEKLAELIKPSGYYNQKAKTIKNFITWFRKYSFSGEKIKKIKSPTNLRKELLEIKGVGPETADSILLYAFKQKFFVVDTYTKRIFTRLNLLGKEQNYDQIQAKFHLDFKGNLKDYQEYHALIVAQAKTFCLKKPRCSLCPLKRLCSLD